MASAGRRSYASYAMTDSSPSAGARHGVLEVGLVLTTRPGLWPIAIAQLFRLARPGWWRSWPPLPVPTDALWRLRMVTAYGGDGSSAPSNDDIISYLNWCRGSVRWRER